MRFVTPTALALLALTLTSCHRGTANAPAHHDGKIDCAIGAAAKLETVCDIDREETADGLSLTIHHRDGGFRRLLITSDGRGVVAADGASVASVIPLGDHEIEVVIENDRYHLPATVRGAVKGAVKP